MVLFFSVTGITLNHPEWTLGASEIKREVKGKVDPGLFKDGKADWLPIVEQLRKEQGAHGSAEDMRVNDSEATLVFKAPGYNAEGLIDTKTGEYRLTISAQGSLSILNDLHRGRDSGKGWGWLIDISGVFLCFVGFTGIGILFYLKKVRISGLVVFAVGTVIVLVLMKIAI